MYPDPAKIVKDIDQLITQHEDELAVLQDALPENRLAWSWEDHKSIIAKKAKIGYLRDHGRTDALITYSYGLLSELVKLKGKDLDAERTKIRRHAARIKTAERNFRLAVLTGYKIAKKKPKTFRSGGKYAHLAKLVCKELDWPDTKISRVRRNLAATNILDHLD